MEAGVGGERKGGGGGAGERSELTAGGLAVAAEGSGLWVHHKWDGDENRIRPGPPSQAVAGWGSVVIYKVKSSI